MSPSACRTSSRSSISWEINVVVFLALMIVAWPGRRRKYLAPCALILFQWLYIAAVNGDGCRASDSGRRDAPHMHRATGVLDIRWRCCRRRRSGR